MVGIICETTTNTLELLALAISLIDVAASGTSLRSFPRVFG